jgi:flagellin
VSPEDDAGGLAVSMRFESQISRLGAAQSNIGNAISFSQAQDGFLKKVGKALDRMSEIATLAQDVTKTTTDLDAYQLEFGELQSYITDVAAKQFNGVDLFGGATLSVTVDSEADTAAGMHDIIGVDLGGVAYTAATAGTAVVDTAAAAQTSLGLVKTAIDALSADRAQIGANISVLGYYNEGMGVLQDNLAAANSRIKDVDVAAESTRFARYNILVQAGTAMLAQANATPQSALRLLS